MSLLENNSIELKVGDVYRENKAHKFQKVVNIFEYNGEKFYNIIDTDKDYGIRAANAKYLCGVDLIYGNVWNGIVEVNGKKIRGIGGKLLRTPKDVIPKTKKSIARVEKQKSTKSLTDFQKFLKVQNSGRINMTDIVTVSMLAGISEEKYEDIMWHYDEYKSGKRN